MPLNYTHREADRLKNRSVDSPTAPSIVLRFASPPPLNRRSPRESKGENAQREGTPTIACSNQRNNHCALCPSHEKLHGRRRRARSIPFFNGRTKPYLSSSNRRPGVIEKREPISRTTTSTGQLTPQLGRGRKSPGERTACRRKVQWHARSQEVGAQQQIDPSERRAANASGAA
uniref:Uncharacterized protein n=1 Tax=Trichuris muris TaxID=70415 RepID=A0A5S6QL53_TRIMR